MAKVIYDLWYQDYKAKIEIEKAVRIILNLNINILMQNNIFVINPISNDNQQK